jgi:hypothetical protein
MNLPKRVALSAAALALFTSLQMPASAQIPVPTMSLMPNLVVDRIYYYDEAHTLVLVIRNTGVKAGASASQTSVTDLDTGQTRTFSTPSIPPLSKVEIGIGQPSARRLHVRVDARQQVAESNESDNQFLMVR